jgi:hypothetical protein
MKVLIQNINQFQRSKNGSSQFKYKKYVLATVVVLCFVLVWVCMLSKEKDILNILSATNEASKIDEGSLLVLWYIIRQK